LLVKENKIFWLGGTLWLSFVSEFLHKLPPLQMGARNFKKLRVNSPLLDNYGPLFNLFTRFIVTN